MRDASREASTITDSGSPRKALSQRTRKRELKRKPAPGGASTPPPPARKVPTATVPTASAALLIGFAPEEVAIVRRNLTAIFPPDELQDSSGGEGEPGQQAMQRPRRARKQRAEGGSPFSHPLPPLLPAVLAVGKAASSKPVGRLIGIAFHQAAQERLGEDAGLRSAGSGCSTMDSPTLSDVASVHDAALSEVTPSPPSAPYPAPSPSLSSSSGREGIETRGGLAEGRVVLLYGQDAQVINQSIWAECTSGTCGLYNIT